MKLFKETKSRFCWYDFTVRGRLVPMSRRVAELLRSRCATRSEGWVFPSSSAASGHLCSIVKTAMYYQHPELH